MQKDVLLDLLTQNQFTAWAAFDDITPENASFRLNPQAASAGFIYRHVGETLNMFSSFFGLPNDVQSITMGQTDEGQGQNIQESHQLVEQGYKKLQDYIENTPDAVWLELIETPFWGTVSKARMFGHILNHTAYHQGQIVLTLKRGKENG